MRRSATNRQRTLPSALLALLLWPLGLDAELAYEFQRLYLREQVRAQLPVAAPVVAQPTPRPEPTPAIVPAHAAWGYVSPVGHWNVSGWGFSEQHPAVDLWCVEGQTKIRSMGAGIIIASGWTDDGCGYNVTVDHGGGRTTRYCHMQPPLATGSVGKGGYLGMCGASGWSGGRHLHLEMWDNGVPVDPGSFLGGN